MNLFRLAPWLVLVGPLGLLAGALLSQYVGGLNPCPMCIWQRWPHAIAIVLAAAALLLGRGKGGMLFYLAAATLLIGAGIGYFHAGVEQGWWQGPTTCVGGSTAGLSTEAAIDQIFNAPLVRCDDIVWSFAGLSMAAWNGLISTGLGVAAVIAARVYASSSASQ